MVPGVIFAIASFGLDRMMSVATLFSVMFALGAVLSGIGRLRQRQLARLRTQGTAYDADSIDYMPSQMVNMLWARDYLVFHAYFSYTDHKGSVHTTKTRRYAMRLDRSETQFVSLEEFVFSARVYVNPNNPRDYAVVLRMENL